MDFAPDIVVQSHCANIRKCTFHKEFYNDAHYGRMVSIMIGNPKRRADNPVASPFWYNYYAGYSERFVSDMLSHLSLPDSSTVLDPWNGTGTTTAIASIHGHNVVGFDINPALVLVAKARLLSRNVAASLSSIGDDLILKTQKSVGQRLLTATNPDPLENWFEPNTARRIRTLEGKIQLLLINGTQHPSLLSASTINNISSLAAFFYVALFRTVRSFLSHFEGSNPTWIKTAKSQEELIEVSTSALKTRFLGWVSHLAKYIETKQIPEFEADALISVGHAEEMPLSESSVSSVITSPPYCTRIDYAIATLPELAILRYDDESLRKLRDQLLGTPTVNRSMQNLEEREEWGGTCNTFLRSVEGHTSKASKSYYKRYYMQYFTSLYRSLTDIDRVLEDSGSCAVVVQDSYYKDIHNDLPLVVHQMGNTIGWTLESKFPFDVKSNMAKVHVADKLYRSKTKAVEVVLVFRKRLAA